MVGYRQTNQKTDTGKTLTRWPVFVDHFKLIVAGQLRTAEQAEDAVKAGVSLVAIGQGMIMNPDWVKFADGKAEGKIALNIAASDADQLGCVP
ncbi:hypothetical protein ABK898_24945 [Klebsiella sp. KE9038]|uniref:hypothetical protein n=1 Tax=Klebsiella sp. KE9038 TaxID=3118149 RepID=UPI00375078E5